MAELTGRFDDFDAALDERDQNAYRFTLGGREFLVPPVDASTIGVLGALGHRMQSFSDEDPDGVGKAVMALTEFIATVLAEPDREPFLIAVALRRPGPMILAKISERIAEQVAGRPLDQPALPPPPLPTTG